MDVQGQKFTQSKKRRRHVRIMDVRGRNLQCKRTFACLADAREHRLFRPPRKTRDFRWKQRRRDPRSRQISLEFRVSILVIAIFTFRVTEPRYSSFLASFLAFQEEQDRLFSKLSSTFHLSENRLAFLFLTPSDVVSEFHRRIGNQSLLLRTDGVYFN